MDKTTFKYCQHCGNSLQNGTPPISLKVRRICHSCNTDHLETPQILVGCIAEHQGKVLVCRRAIEPRKHFWSLPAGYMEQGETTPEGAARETAEEAKAITTGHQLYRLIELPHINQIYLIYRCHIQDGEFGTGEETLETRLIGESDISAIEFAFPLVREVLLRYFLDAYNGTYSVKVIGDFGGKGNNMNDACTVTPIDLNGADSSILPVIPTRVSRRRHRV